MGFQVPRMDERESAAWLGLITVCQVLPAALDTQLQRDAKMTHFDFLALSALRFAQDNTLRMSELAEITSSTLPRLSHVCTRLEKRGHVERFTSADDRRATNVKLTESGGRALTLAMPKHLENVRNLVVDALSPEQLDALTEITGVIRSRLTGPTTLGDQLNAPA